jgi:hypothetical protein
VLSLCLCVSSILHTIGVYIVSFFSVTRSSSFWISIHLSVARFILLYQAISGDEGSSLFGTQKEKEKKSAFSFTDD